MHSGPRTVEGGHPASGRRWAGGAWRAVMIGLAALVLGACTGDISQETFDQIQTGMPLSEVQTIMGADGEKQDTTEMSISSAGVLGSKESRQELWLWTSTSRKQEIAVEFRDGKVVSKSKRGF